MIHYCMFKGGKIMTKEVATYISMRDTELLIEQIQGRIYCYDNIPLEKRDELSLKLYEIRKELKKYSEEQYEECI